MTKELYLQIADNAKEFDKEELVRLISLLDEYLVKFKKWFDEHQGVEVDTKLYEELEKKIVYDIKLRRALAKVLLYRFGTVIMNDWEL